MEGLVMIYVTITVVAGAIALWLHTQMGQEILGESLMDKKCRSIAMF